MNLKNMTLGRRLVLMTCAALLLVVGAGLFGVEAANRAARGYSMLLDAEVVHQRLAMDTVLDFKTQVQEWKNTLLRGKDPAQLAKYWAAFQKHEAAVQEKARRLAGVLPAGEARDLAGRFVEAHAVMGEKYRKGFDAFKASGHDAAAGDVAVKGMDREPAALLERLADLEVAALDKARASADDARTSARDLAWALMAGALAAGLAGGLLIARAVTRELGGEPADARAAAQRIARGDLATAIPVRPGDTTTLFAALGDMQKALLEIVRQVRPTATAWPRVRPRSPSAMPT